MAEDAARELPNLRLEDALQLVPHVRRATISKVLVAPNASGVSFGCVSASADVIAAIRANPSNYYVNVHTTDFPDGAIRGQL